MRMQSSSSISFRTIAFAFALIITFASGARATTVPLTFDEIVTKSDVVARVTVVEASSRWVGRRIITFHELRVDEVLHGATASRTVTLAVPGGVVDGIGQRVFGAPELRKGSSYVLCMSPELTIGTAPPDRGRAIVGLWRGAWKVQPDMTLAPFAHDAHDGNDAKGAKDANDAHRDGAMLPSITTTLTMSGLREQVRAAAQRERASAGAATMGAVEVRR